MGRLFAVVWQQTPRRSDSSKRCFLTSGRGGSVALMAAWAGVDTLIFSSDFHDWCFNLAGTVNLGVGAPQVLCPNRVSLVIHFPGTYGGPAQQRLFRPRRSPRPPRPFTTDPEVRNFRLKYEACALLFPCSVCCRPMSCMRSVN